MEVPIYAHGGADLHTWNCYRKPRTWSWRDKEAKEWLVLTTAALIFLRGINHNLDFQLACNLEDAQHFVDLVLKYKTPSSTAWNSSFIHLKIGQDVVLKRKALTIPQQGGFSLRKYLKSYRSIKKLFEDQIGDLLFKGSFEKCDFIIYTGATLDRDLANRHREVIGGPIRKLLSSEMIKERVVRFNEKVDPEMFVGMASAGKDAKEFLQKLFLFTGEPNEAQINDLLKHELRKRCIQYKNDVESILNHFIEGLRKWWRQNKVSFINNSSSILENAVQQYVALKISLSQKQLYWRDVAFQIAALGDIETALSSARLLVCVQTRSKNTLRLTCIKILTKLHDEEFFFIDLVCLSKNEESILAAWANSSAQLMVIVADSTALDNPEAIRPEVFESICAVLESHRHKQVLMIHTKDDEFAVRLQQKLEKQFEVFRDVFSLSQLAQQQIKRLSLKKVELQGSPILLRDLISFHNKKEANDVLAQSFFDILNANETIFVGDKLSDVSTVYIARTLLRWSSLKPSILTEFPATDTIAVSGVSTPDLQRLVASEKVISHVASPCSFLAINASNAEREYEQLIGTRDSVHWISKKHNFKWRRSSNDIGNIMKFIDNTVCSTHRPVTVFDLEDRVVLIAAESGSGKSMMLADIAQRTKAAYPAYWVVHVDLEKHGNILDRVSQFDISAITFLMTVMRMEVRPQLEADLFRYALEESGNVVVLIDGFDKLSTDCVKTGAALLIDLLRTKAHKVWVTSDFYTKRMLEKVLLTLAFTIKSLNKDAEKIVSDNYKRAYQVNLF